MQKVNEFMENLLKEKGISIDDEEVKKQVISDMAKNLEEQVNRACINALSEEKAKELAEKIEKPDFTKEKMAEFMKNSGVDMEKITLETTRKFREFYLNGEKQNA